MKLRNKLIPLISLTATATAVAPLASCGNVSLTEASMTDVLHGYLPDIARAEASDTLTAEQAKDLYVDHVKKNPEIFAQDLYWWESVAVKYRLAAATYEGSQGYDESFEYDLQDLYGLYPISGDVSFSMIPQTAKFSVTDISIGEEKLVNPSYEEETGYTISLKLNFEYQYELDADCANGTSRYSAQRVTTVSMTSEYKNIPFTVMWDTEYAMWRVVPVGWFSVPENDSTWILKKLNNWSFNFDKKSVTVDTIKNFEGGVDTYTYDNSQGGLIDSWAKMVKWVQEAYEQYGDEGYKSVEAAIRSVVFNFGSYHLYDIAGPQWSHSNLGLVDKTFIDDVDEENLTVYLLTESAFNRNWTTGEYQSHTRPITLEDSNQAYWKLASSIENLPVSNQKTGEQVAKASILTTNNAQMNYNEDDDVCPTHDVASYQNLNLVTKIEFKLKPDSESTEEEQALYRANYIACVENSGIRYFLNNQFILPTATEFKIDVPYYTIDESTGKYVIEWRSESFKLTSDLNCLWYSTGDVIL